MTRRLLAMIAAGPVLALGLSAAALAQPADFEVSLERGACFGTCPVYSVTIHQDGLVEYEGQGWVKAMGRQTSHVSPDAVRKLYNQIEAMRFFELAPRYEAKITDQATQVLTVRMGGAVHRVEDYAGQIVGMPPAVVDLETAVDQTAGVERWVGSLEERRHLSRHPS